MIPQRSRRVWLVGVLVCSLVNLVSVNRTSATPIPIEQPGPDEDCGLACALAVGVVVGVAAGGGYIIYRLSKLLCDPPISGSYNATGTSPGSESYGLTLPPQTDGLSNAAIQNTFTAGTSGFTDNVSMRLQRFTGSIHGEWQGSTEVDYTTSTAVTAIPVAVNLEDMSFGIKKNVGADEVGWHDARFRILLETSGGATYDLFEGGFEYNATATSRTWTATGDWSNSDWTQMDAVHNGQDFIDVTHTGTGVEAFVPVGLDAGETYTILYEIVYDYGSAPEPQTLCLLALGGWAVVRRRPGMRRCRGV